MSLGERIYRVINNVAESRSGTANLLITRYYSLITLAEASFCYRHYTQNRWLVSGISD